MSFAEKLFGTFSDREMKKILPVQKAVLALEGKYTAYSDAELQAQTPILRERLAQGETLDAILPDAFAVCREASWRVLGMKHFPVQVIGGIALHRGCIAEMQTGEGKTLVATLAVYLNALSGEGVHVVTVNDYLAKRDSEWMGKLYTWLGLRVGLVVQGIMGAPRKAAYCADITYGTNNEFGFDYLRDNMVKKKSDMVQRGHAYAIVDEVDSILVDEARTPLIISGAGEDPSSLYLLADKFVRSLKRSVLVELETKISTDDQVDGDYVVDEKHKSCTLTARGIEKAERYFKLENLSDPENSAITHHIEKSIHAYGAMVRDADYVVKDGEIFIVDEFTGRLMIGRRYSDGLHQAIEAKEGVKINSENKTMATITFQNYFRLYQKLSGMTGTARTEAAEFTEIYGLNIVTVPTNRPNIRKDYPDTIYKTVESKYRAVIAQILECHAKGQPVLVGTVSVEKSEILGKMLAKHTRNYNILNAKYHDREAEIIAQAGKKGAITIATNMAGRGTDIILGGNAEYLALNKMRKEQFAEKLLMPEATDEVAPEAVDALLSQATGHSDTDDANILAARARFETLHAQFKTDLASEADAVRAAGGLFIIGTERHESRRIDNQLRGRAGRQSDPGASHFFLSLEDDLMRLFGGERVQNIMGSLGLEEDMPIENRMLTGTIESSQKKLESRNFEMRKNVLRYDDVMNQQRTIIYGQRQKVLNGEDISGDMQQMMRENIDSSCALFLAGDVTDEWDFAALRNHYLGWLTTAEDFQYTLAERDGLERQAIADLLYERGLQNLSEKESTCGAEIFGNVQRFLLLKQVDRAWVEHIDNMDQLRQGIRLRSYAQRDPIVEYRVEGFEMFDEMVDAIREETVKALLNARVRVNLPAASLNQSAPKITRTGFAAATAPTKAKANAANDARPAPEKPKQQPIRVSKKIGPNEPCPCGSGKKHKKCNCTEYHSEGMEG
ncbi:MAG: preprotein translocase subunit SecA [Faecalibacterium sp.]